MFKYKAAAHYRARSKENTRKVDMCSKIGHVRHLHTRSSSCVCVYTFPTPQLPPLWASSPRTPSPLPRPSHSLLWLPSPTSITTERIKRERPSAWTKRAGEERDREAAPYKYTSPRYTCQGPGIREWVEILMFCGSRRGGSSSRAAKGTHDGPRWWWWCMRRRWDANEGLLMRDENYSFVFSNVLPTDGILMAQLCF